MSIITALVAARSKMEPLIADKRAKMGAYTFAYAPLPSILDIVIPALAEHNVFLLQDVASTEREVHVVTKLLHDESNISSGAVLLPYDGTPSDFAKKVTTARRVQLLSMLGLAAEEEESQPTAPQRQAPPVRPNPPRPADKTWEQQTPLRNEVTRSRSKMDTAPTHVRILAERLKADDGDDQLAMPTVAAEGKAVSMYDFTVDLIDDIAAKDGAGERVLSFLLGRVISRQTPLKLSHRWLIEDLRSGKYGDAIAWVEGSA